MTKLNKEVLEELKVIGDTILDDLNKNADLHTETIGKSEDTLQAIKGAVEGVKMFFAKVIQATQDAEGVDGQDKDEDSKTSK